jgi:hypothetical protein
MNTPGLTLTNGVLTSVITSNFVTPPYGNCKAVVRATVYITLGTIPTSVVIQLNRNPAAENLLISGSGTMTQGVAANIVGEWLIDGIDQVPDGRPVQYAVSVNVAGTGTNNSATRGVIDVTLLSG